MSVLKSMLSFSFSLLDHDWSVHAGQRLLGVLHGVEGELDVSLLLGTALGHAALLD